jgi:hypothetical protein
MASTGVKKEDGSKKGSGGTGIEELQGYIYSGAKQNNQYSRTTKAIADYCGSRMSPGVWDLIINGEEKQFPAPAEPTGRVTEYSKVRYSREVDMWLRNKNDYNMDKACIFVLIRGQCVKQFWDILKSEELFEGLAKANDVAGLLALIRKLTFENKVSAQFEPCLIVKLIQTLLFTKQSKNEDAVTFYQWFLLALEALESVIGGPFVPFKYMEITTPRTEDNDAAQEETKTNKEVVKPILATQPEKYEQFRTCLFLNAIDRGRYKEWIDGLDTDYVAGTDKYPKNLREAFNQLKDRELKWKALKKANKHKPTTQAAGNHVESSFAQQESKANKESKATKPKSILKNKKTNRGNPHYHLYCDVCGGQGHPADQCTNIVSDSDSENEPTDCVGFGG